MGVLAGIIAGALAQVALGPGAGLPGWALAAAALVTLAMGTTAFVLNERGTRRSNNRERLAFGLIVGALLPMTWCQSPGYFGAFIAAIVAGQFASAFALRRAGLLDGFVDQYLDGAVVRPDEPARIDRPCGHPFCSCGASAFRLSRR